MKKRNLTNCEKVKLPDESKVTAESQELALRLDFNTDAVEDVVSELVMLWGIINGNELYKKMKKESEEISSELNDIANRVYFIGQLLGLKYSDEHGILDASQNLRRLAHSLEVAAKELVQNPRAKNARFHEFIISYFCHSLGGKFIISFRTDKESNGEPKSDCSIFFTEVVRIVKGDEAQLRLKSSMSRIKKKWKGHIPKPNEIMPLEGAFKTLE